MNEVHKDLHWLPVKLPILVISTASSVYKSKHRLTPDYSEQPLYSL